MAVKKAKTPTKAQPAVEVPAKPKKGRKLEVSSKNLKILIVLAIIAGALYLTRSLFLVSIVNGRPITRLEVIKELEKQGGAQTLDSLVTQILVRQEASSRGIVLEQSKVDAQIKTIEESVIAQGQTLDEVLELQGLTRVDFVDQVELQLLVEQMLSDKITITDEQIASYLQENADYMLSEPGSDEAMQEAKRALTQQQISQLLQPLLDEIRTKANIIKIKDY
jgi:foldase protein PrsA